MSGRRERDGSPAILVLHAIGDERGGLPWRLALRSHGWRGPILAPDLPGHCGQAPPTGGTYELTDPALVALRTVHEAGLATAPVVCGIGTSGWSAQLLALGGQACGLVTIDGLGGRWRSAVDVIADSRTLLRSIAADDDARHLAGDGLDPRLRHGVLGQSSRPLAQRVACAIGVPSLVIESPHSAMTLAEAKDLADRFDPPAAVVDVDTLDPEVVAGEVVAWDARRRS